VIITNGIIRGDRNRPGDYGYRDLYYSRYAQAGITYEGNFVETNFEHDGNTYHSGSVIWSGKKGERPFIQRQGWHTFTHKWNSGDLDKEK
jgi:hypothetical protein